MTVQPFGLSLAQSLTLPAAVNTALERGADLSSQRATLANARADLAAKQADPSVLIVALTQSRQGAALEEARTSQRRLEVTQSVLTAYSNLYEAQQNIAVLEAQVALDVRNLEVARARLSARNATQLDVDRANNTLSSSRQSLADARAQLPILSNRLETLLASNSSGNLQVAATPAFAQRQVNQTTLEQGLEARLPNLLQAAQAVELAELNVRLADNDYTPPVTLRDARTNLENARRNLETARQNALTSLRDSVRAVQNALERVRIAQQDAANDQTTLKQDQTRFQSGTISRLQLQQSEVAVVRSSYTALQAVNNYWKALAALSVAAGQDVLGLGGGQ
ncbi:MAG: TolC family protein [Meiothermus sp.]|nr:TolC family protein [Meiothermus sp.]